MSETNAGCDVSGKCYALSIDDCSWFSESKNNVNNCLNENSCGDCDNMAAKDHSKTIHLCKKNKTINIDSIRKTINEFIVMGNNGLFEEHLLLQKIINGDFEHIKFNG